MQMNTNPKTLRQRIKGDLYLVMQKDKFHKVFNPNLQPSNKNTIQVITMGNFKRNSPIKPKSTTLLAQKFQQTDPRNLESRKTKRKNSEVSIVQDILIHQKQHNQLKQTQKQRYTINLSRCQKAQEQNPQKNISKDEKQILEKTKPNASSQSQTINKYKNIKGFFQYILDFKLMNIESYNPKKKQDQYKNINQILLSPRVRKSSKSLKVRFGNDSAEKDSSQSVQQKNELKKQLQVENMQLQGSQASFVDVQVSDVSLQDEMPILKNDFSQNGQKSLSDMKKDKKVYFDFQNPNETSLDEINPLDTIGSNQKIGQTQYKSQSRIVSLQQLKKRIQNAEQEANNYVHHGYFCDDCKVDPIVGRRYKCVECQQYDLCQKCYQHQCKNFRNIMNKYKNDHHNGHIPSKFSFSHFPDISPMMKKKMSDIKEEQSPSQNFSSQEGIFVSSQNDTLQDEHVHIMQEVKKTRPQFQQNLQKVLRQSTKCSNHLLLKSTQRNSQNPNQYLQPLTPQLPKHRALNSSRIPFSKISFSQRTIPFRMSENGQTKLLESNKSKVEEIKKTSSQIRNLFT